MKNEKYNKSVSPKKDEHYRWKVTNVMKDETYHGMLHEEMEETVSAVVLSETYPDVHSYKNKVSKKDKNEKE